MAAAQNKIQWLLLALVLVVLSCNSEKRAIKKDNKAIAAAKVSFAKHPEVFAGQCAIQFPVRTFDSTPAPLIEFKKGGGVTVKNTSTSDQTNFAIDLLQSNINDRRHLIDSFKRHPFIVKGDCPPVYVPYPDTIMIKQEHYKTLESQSLAIALRAEKDSLATLYARAQQRIIDDKANYVKLQVKYKHLKYGVIVLLIIIIAYTVLKISGKIKLL